MLIQHRINFMIDATRSIIEAALLNQTLLEVDNETYDRLVEILDRPANGSGVERLMKAAQPWAGASGQD